MSNLKLTPRELEELKRNFPPDDRDVYHEGLEDYQPREDYPYPIAEAVVALSREIYPTWAHALARFEELAVLRKLKLLRRFRTARHYCFEVVPT